MTTASFWFWTADLVRYAKFSLSVLAIFLVVGAFFYGIDLRQSADELEQIP